MWKYKRITKDKKTKLEHRVIIENNLGRNLDIKEIVHHINGNQEDNRIENLKILTHSEHNKIHKIIPRIEIKCKECGKIFNIREKFYNWRKARGQIDFFCSDPCRINNKGYKNIKEENIEKIYRLHKEGNSGYKIAKLTNINYKTIYNYLNKLK